MTSAKASIVFPDAQKRLISPASLPPTLMVVVDTEEEFNWHAPVDATQTSVDNIKFQPFAQDILDANGMVPTYVIDYPVATTPTAADLLRTFLTEGRCEIGAHLHPWVNPPAEGPISLRHSYPGNLPPELERSKLLTLTRAITVNFDINPQVYKAGRYGIGMSTPLILQEFKYSVDISIVPHTDFSGDGGPDFRSMPAGPFMITPELLELPLSVHFVGWLARFGPRVYPRLQRSVAHRLRLGGICARLGLLQRLRLTPEGHTLQNLIDQTRTALATGNRVFMLTYHSSSLLPGATDYVRSVSERSAFLARLDGYLRFFRSEVGGEFATVTQVAAVLGTDKGEAFSD